jgi:hypothetical protein
MEIDINAIITAVADKFKEATFSQAIFALCVIIFVIKSPKILEICLHHRRLSKQQKDEEERARGRYHLEIAERRAKIEAVEKRPGGVSGDA